MTPQQENEAIATWAGIECRCVPFPSAVAENEMSDRYYGNCPRHNNNGLPPDYDRDEVAISLLPILVSKTGRVYVIEAQTDKTFRCLPKYISPQYPEWHPTIAAAIKSACLQLIEREKS